MGKNNKITKIILNGKEYSLSFNFGVISAIQSSIKDLKVSDVFTGIEAQDFKIISEVLYRGIKFNHPTFKRDEVELLEIEDIPVVMDAITNVLLGSMPENEEKDTEEKK